MYQRRLQTSLMTYFASYLHLVDILFIGIGENQSGEVAFQVPGPTNSSTGKSSTSSSSRCYTPIDLVDISACATTWQLAAPLQA